MIQIVVFHENAITYLFRAFYPADEEGIIHILQRQVSSQLAPYLIGSQGNSEVS